MNIPVHYSVVEIKGYYGNVNNNVGVFRGTILVRIYLSSMRILYRMNTLVKSKKLILKLIFHKK